MFPAVLQPVDVPPPRSSQLPLVRLDAAAVCAPRAKIRERRLERRPAHWRCSFGEFAETLRLDSWSLYHAAFKTSLASSWSIEDVQRGALGFALQHDALLAWDRAGLRTSGSGPFELQDFAAAGLAGRLGEAIAYLAMVNWGYIYWDRCSVVWQREATHARVEHLEQLRRARALQRAVRSGRPSLEPDFVFEKESGEVALMEAKASVVNPATDRPTVKRDLSQALAQLAAWTSAIEPRPSRRLAIGTYLRGQHDTNNDPSLIAYVDDRDVGADSPHATNPNDRPNPDTANSDPRRSNGGAIRRCNYGAWLIGMGLQEQGRALRGMRMTDTVERPLRVITLRGRRIAVRAIGVNYGTGDLDELLSRPWMWDPYHWEHWIRHRRVLVFGLEATVMRSLGSALRTLDARIEAPKDIAGDNASLVDDSSYGSFMPDGSFIGMVGAHELMNAAKERFDL